MTFSGYLPKVMVSQAATITTILSEIADEYALSAGFYEGDILLTPEGQEGFGW